MLAFAANFFSGLAFALFLLLPGYLTDLGADETQLGVIFGLTAVASIAMRPFLGTAMDRYGRRPVILVGNIINITFILFYLTVSVLGPWVYVVRIGHGVAEAMLFSALFTYGTDVVPSSRRTEGLAMFGVSGLLPIAFAGIIGDIDPVDDRHAETGKRTRRAAARRDDLVTPRLELTRHLQTDPTIRPGDTDSCHAHLHHKRPRKRPQHSRRSPTRLAAVISGGGESCR